MFSAWLGGGSVSVCGVSWGGDSGDVFDGCVAGVGGVCALGCCSRSLFGEGYFCHEG